MASQTVELLKECESGCKMAINSMDQVLEYARDEQQKQIILAYIDKHKHLEKDIIEQLKMYGEGSEEPGLMATAMSWISTEMKMMLRSDCNQVSKIMMDGCNMGVQSVCEYINKYTEASKESVQLAKKLVKIEEDFMDEMKKFL